MDKIDDNDQIIAFPVNDVMTTFAKVKKPTGPISLTNERIAFPSLREVSIRQRLEPVNKALLILFSLRQAKAFNRPVRYFFKPSLGLPRKFDGFHRSVDVRARARAKALLTASSPRPSAKSSASA
jgi:hypothetical protein